MKLASRFILCITLLSTLSVLLPACSGTSDNLSLESKAQIYATVIKRLEEDFGGQPRGYIMTYTDDEAGTASESSNSTDISPALQKAVLTALSGYSKTYSWVDTIDGLRDEIMSPGGASQIILGNIHQQEDGPVQVTASLFFGGTGGGGTTYVLESRGGVWEVTGTTGAMWIS